MGFFDFFMNNGQDKQPKERVVDQELYTEFAEENASVLLHEEKLDIDKARVTTGEVILNKEVIEEQKTVEVPVTHEQVVIERRTFDAEPTNETITEGESIRIPVSADRVGVDKYTVVTGEVSAHKRDVEETQVVQDVLHKEVADVEVEGDAEIINKG